jgi:hypothetical protein
MDEGQEQERNNYIEIPSYGLEWWNLDYHELHGGWQLLLMLTDSIVAQENIYVGEHPIRISQIKGHQPNWDKLRERCLTQETPLSYLIIAFEMLDHNTQNIFIDPTDEMPVEPTEWSIENMDYLIQEHQEAIKIRDKAHLLLDWIVAEPLNNIEKVIELWNECLEK